MENTTTNYRSLVGFEQGARKIHVHETDLDGVTCWKQQHTHDAEEAVYMIQGEARFTFDGNTHHVRPGETVFFPAGVEHAEASFQGDKVRYLVIRSVEPEEGPCCCGMDLPPREHERSKDIGGSDSTL